jgi:steroid delta-isomerase-like uncharacterized protein
MSTEENKAVVRRWYEALFNQGDLAVADEIVAADYVAHDPANLLRQNGIEGAKGVVTQFRTACPDIHFVIEDEMAVADRVIVRWKGSGTQIGELMGIPPTGRRGVVPGISIFRLANGKISEEWVNWDSLGMMQQLGVIPTPG